MLTLRTYRNVFNPADRLFEEATRPMPADRAVFALPVDVRLEGSDYLITATVPGLDPKDVNIEIVQNEVTIKGEIPAPAVNENDRWLLQERRYGKFARTLTFAVDLESAAAEAHVANGVLTLRVPQAEAARPKVVAVKAK